MDRLEAIERLVELRNSGVLSDTEYNEQKRILMTSAASSVTIARVERAAEDRFYPIREEAPRSVSTTPSAQVHIHNSNVQASMSHRTIPINFLAKSTLVAYILWFFLWFVSAHRLYLRRPVSAVFQILSFFILIGFVWLLFDLFLIPGMVDKHNREIAGA